MKEKIAISLDENLLKTLDQRIDGTVIRSRSQAIELYLKKGLHNELIETAVMMVSRQHQKLLIEGHEPLLNKQIAYLKRYGINTIIILTQQSPTSSIFKEKIKNIDEDIIIREENSQGNAHGLFMIKDLLTTDFVALGGDVFNNFDLINMMRKHTQANKLLTMGLMTVKDSTTSYGVVTIDGDLVVSFEEKQRVDPASIVNAGTYIFKPEVFHLFTDNTISLEKELFPQLAKLNQIVGFFTMGEYVHLTI